MTPIAECRARGVEQGFLDPMMDLFQGPDLLALLHRSQDVPHPAQVGKPKQAAGAGPPPARVSCV